MLDLRQASRPVGLGLALVAVALLDVFSLALTLRSQSRLHERAAASLREAMLRLRPRLESMLEPGDEPAWRAAAEEAFRSTPAASIEIVDSSGLVLAAYPRAGAAAAPAAGSGADLSSLRLGEVLTLGPTGVAEARFRSFVAVASGGRKVVVCVSSDATDLAQDAHDRHQLLIAHAITGAILLLVIGLALLPAGQPGETLPPKALGALEEAIHRLRARDEQLSRQHREEVDAFENQLRDLSALARAAELTAGIAHEMRNGLGTILGYARLLERGAVSNESAEAAHDIAAECEALETTIRRFMEFAKHEKLRLTRVDLGRMLARVVAREARGGEDLEVALDTSEAGEILGDEELLERAFENIVRNAREAAGPGGHVWVAARRHDKSSIASVSDDGPGLPAELSAVLRPFATTKPGGLGLGLPMAMKIVQLHQGELSLTPRAPRGVVAEVRLPIDGPVELGPIVT